MTQLPPDVYQRILLFLNANSTGHIELHVKDGVILECVVTRVERLRVERERVIECSKAS